MTHEKVTRHAPGRLHLSLSSPRIRFNWGFWDGFADRQGKHPNRGHLRHEFRGSFPLPDGKDAASRAYRNGYAYGYAETGNPTSSEPAWRHHKA